MLNLLRDSKSEATLLDLAARFEALARSSEILSQTFAVIGQGKRSREFNEYAGQALDIARAIRAFLGALAAIATMVDPTAEPPADEPDEPSESSPGLNG